MSPWKTSLRQWRLSAPTWFYAFIPHELAGGVGLDNWCSILLAIAARQGATGPWQEGTFPSYQQDK